MQSKNVFYALVLLGFASLNLACDKNQDDQVSTELDAATTAIVVELSSTVAQDLAKLGTHSAQSQLLSTGVCGATQDTTFSNNFSKGGFSKTGTMTLEWTLLCNQAKVPTSVKLVAMGAGSLNSKIMSSSSDNDGLFTMTGLVKNATVYQLDGTFKQIAQPVSKVWNETHFYSQIDAVVSKLTVSKDSSHTITGGTVSFQMQTGKLREQAQVLAEGTIVFKGNKQATVTVNDKTYQVDLN